MSSKQTMLEPNKGEGGLGPVNGYSQSNTETLSKIFTFSPIIGKTITYDDNEATGEFETVLQKPSSAWKGSNPDFPEFDPKFGGAPDMDNVKTGGGGDPASPYVPNPASPGPGSTNPTDIPAPPEGFGQQPTNGTFGKGAGTENPSKTSNAIASVKLGDYLSPADQPGQSLYTDG
tara:strand:+ start:46250 stop:46774 length:525 start_codon:yes stop_codon:yes gene_type:complete